MPRLHLQQPPHSNRITAIYSYDGKATRPEPLERSTRSTRSYHPVLDTLTGVKVTGTPGTAVWTAYEYDSIGNLTQRSDYVSSVAESFTYDALNRLTSSGGPGLASRFYEYDAIGNVLYKSDVGAYSYGDGTTTPRHAVLSVGNGNHPNSITASYTYDANGNLAGATGTIYSATGSAAFTRTLSYMSFNLPVTISQTQSGSTTSYTYTYSAEHERVRLVTARPTETLTSLYIHPGGAGSLLYEKETRSSDGRIQHKHYVTGGAGLVGVYVIQPAYGGNPAEEGMRYLHTDQVGSVAAVTNSAGVRTATLGYEAFGERREASGAQQNRESPLTEEVTDRGYTGHEHLDELNVIHMPSVVFLSIDPREAIRG